MKNPCGTVPGLLLAVGLPAVQAAELNLPDLLTFTNGAKVVSLASWQTQRRPELLELFREHVYGRAPVGRPANLRFEITSQATNTMDGRATRKQIKICYGGPGGEGAMQLLLFVPNSAARPVPCFLFICNREKEVIDPERKLKSPFWPAEQIIARGYAAATFLNEDLDPDYHDGFTNGVHRLFDPPRRGPDAWGTIAAWAWGASRAMDYFETDREVDPRRVALVGHSRGGKTALWAGAQDDRFAMIVSNESGCTGAALARGKVGERVKDINQRFPHWFCENYKRYNGREADLPVDQHMLLALILPRLLYVASASEDTWADPRSEFLAAVHTAPVCELFGFKSLAGTSFPQPDSPVQAWRIGYHLRTGKHDLTAYDWTQFMNFADQHLRSPAQPARE